MALNKAGPDLETDPSQKVFPIFTARDGEQGFEFMMAGCLPMQAAANMPEYVRGIVRMKDRNIPVVDLDAKAGAQPRPLTSDTCIVLYEHHQGPQTVETGAIYDSIDALIEQIRGKLESRLRR